MKSLNVFRVLAFGDIIGDPGRIVLRNTLKTFRDKYMPDTVIVNGENSAHGFGVTKGITEELLNSGIDVITSGNHIWQRKEIFNFINDYPSLLRPINYPPGTEGNGSVVLEKGGVKYAVINAMGRIYMEPIDCPFQKVRSEAERLKKEGVSIILVDFHAEATSEKQIFGRYFDGKISAVWGTHTHVQTSDEKILPNGSAYISDIGMCGCVESIIGMKIAESHRRVIEHYPARFSPADSGPLEVNGVIIDIDKQTGKAILITRIKEEAGVYKQKGS
jgi:hypothetical protein